MVNMEVIKMALIKCPECGKEISDSADVCPNCGFSIKSYIQTMEAEQSEIKLKQKFEQLKEFQKAQLQPELKKELADVDKEQLPSKPVFKDVFFDNKGNMAILWSLLGAFGLVFGILLKTSILTIIGVVGAFVGIGAFISSKSIYDKKMKDYNEKANVSEYKEKKKANIKCSYSLHPIITGKYDSDYHYLCPICGERLLKLDGSISDTCIHCGIKIPTPYISLHKHEYYHNLAGQKFSANVVVNGNMGRFRWGELVEEEASANPLFNADECKKRQTIQSKVAATQSTSITNQHKLKCPICGSTNIRRISTLNRGVSVAAVGLASSKIGKQYECKSCKHKW